MERVMKIYYSMGRIGSTALLGGVSLVTFYYYNFRFHLNPLLNGFALASGNIAIILSSMFIGYISDRLEKIMLGRRKYFIFTGSILLAFSFFMIYIPQLFALAQDQIMLWIYESVWVSSFFFFYGYLTIPHLAMLPEISQGIERVEISAYLNMFNIIGSGVGLLISGIIALYMRNDSVLVASLAVFSLLEILLYLPVILKVPETRNVSTRKSLFSEIIFLLKHKTFVSWNVAQGLIEIGTTILTTLILVYFQKTGIVSRENLVYAIIAGIFILISYLSWPRGRRRFHTITLLSANVIFIAGALSLTPLLLEYKPLLILFFSLLGSGLIGYWIYRYVIVAELAEEAKTFDGVMRSALYYGINNVSLNLFLSLGHALSGVVASMPEEIWIPYFGYFIIPFLLAGVLILLNSAKYKIKEL